MFFNCTILHKISDGDSKKKKFHYLVDAMTFTEAEANCYKIAKDQNVSDDFSIDNIAKTNISIVRKDEDSDDIYDKWIHVQYGIIGLDEESGDEVIASKEEAIILCKSIDRAVEILRKENGNETFVPIASKRTNIVDVYDNEKLEDIVS